ncbi:Ribosomal protein L9/RNase H1, N-terminal [Sesbania bispinosa]|nr:Ribosomal protein L9/RNase H1, N-terminal [Sesbania bispinosa]
MPRRGKCYCVYNGRRPGIYGSWAECQQQIKGSQERHFDHLALPAVQGQNDAPLPEGAGEPNIVEGVPVVAAEVVRGNEVPNTEEELKDSPIVFPMVVGFLLGVFLVMFLYQLP